MEARSPSLIGEHQGIRLGALYAGCHSRGAAVSGFKHIHVKVIIGKNRAAHGSHTHYICTHAGLFKSLCYQTVDYAVVAAGAIVEGLVGKVTCFFKYY